MTLNIKIGKYINDENIENRGVKLCPIADYDICNPLYTLWPRESYRSGWELWDFWERCAGIIFYCMLEYPDIKYKDFSFSYLKPYIYYINTLSNDNCKDEVDMDRMKWLKFWANRAIELYGDDACIEFC